MVARPGHPLENATGLTLRAIVNASWVLHPPGSVLRHRFDWRFRKSGSIRRKMSSIRTIFWQFRACSCKAICWRSCPRKSHASKQFGVERLGNRFALPDGRFRYHHAETQLLSPAATVVLNALRDAAIEVYGTLEPSSA